MRKSPYSSTVASPPFSSIHRPGPHCHTLILQRPWLTSLAAPRVDPIFHGSSVCATTTCPPLSRLSSMTCRSSTLVTATTCRSPALSQGKLGDCSSTNPEESNVEQAKQTIEWGRLDMEQFKHLVLGHWVYIWFYG